MPLGTTPLCSVYFKPEGPYLTKLERHPWPRFRRVESNVSNNATLVMLDSRSKSPYRARSGASPSKIWYLRRYRTLLLTLTGLSFLFYYFSHRQPFFAPKHEPSLRYKSVDWSYYAYSQYATNSAYLCNSVMVFEALDRLGSKADRILLYPEEWDLEITSLSDRDSQLLVKAREWYNVKLVPIQVQKFETNKGWRNGLFSQEAVKQEQSTDTRQTAKRRGMNLRPNFSRLVKPNISASCISTPMSLYSSTWTSSFFFPLPLWPWSAPTGHYLRSDL